MSGPKQYVVYNGVSMATEDYVKIRDKRETVKVEVKEDNTAQDKFLAEVAEVADVEKEEWISKQEARVLYKAKYGKLPWPRLSTKEIIAKLYS